MLVLIICKTPPPSVTTANSEEAKLKDALNQPSLISNPRGICHTDLNSGF